MVGRELTSRFFEDRTRPRTTVRPSVRIRDLDRAFTNVLRRTHAHTEGATPPGVHPTSTSRDVSDQAFPGPSLSNFYYVARAGEGLGTRLTLLCAFSLFDL